MKTKRLFASLLCLVLLVTSVITSSVTTYAATGSVKSITLNVQSKLTMYIGSSKTIKVTGVTPKGSSTKVLYESSAPDVVKVTPKGTMKALKAGSATVTITSAFNKNINKKIKVTVKNLVKNSTQNKAVIPLDTKKTLKLSLIVKASKLSFSSSKKSVATVDSKGAIKAKKAGTAKITVKGVGGASKGAKQILTVYVVKKSVKTVSLNVSSKTLQVNKSFRLKTTVNPTSAANVVTYKSSKSSVATVNANGKVTGKKAGTARITATTVDGKKKAVCVVVVQKTTEPTEKVTPTKTVTPTEAAAPTRKVTPTGAVEPTREVTPTETMNPTESTKPTETANPTDTVKPTEAAKTTEAAKPTETAKPTESVKPTESAKPTETAKPTESVKPTESAKPTETTKPEQLTTRDLYEKVPYISTYYFEPKPDYRQDVVIPIYVTDHEQSEYLKNDINKTIDLLYEVDGQEYYIRDMKLGDNEVNLGKLAIGEHYFALQAIDKTTGLKSHKLYNDLLVVDPEKEKITAEQTYQITEEDLAKYKINKESSTEEADLINTRDGLNQLFVDIQAKGYRKCILPEGTYRIQSKNRTECIKIPSYLTVDMNGSTFKLDTVKEDIGALLVSFDKAVDAHLINGTVEGDRFERKELGLEHGYLGEGINTIGISGGRYCSIEHLSVKNTTGHTVGVTGAYEAGVWPANFTHVKIADGIEEEDENCSTSDMVDLTKIKEQSDYVMVGNCFGYRGLRGESPIVYIHFYNENQEFLETITAYQYRKTRMPENAKYARATYLGNVQTNDSAIFFYKDYGSYHAITNIDFYDTRTTAIASAGNNILIENCTYTRCGNSITASSVDFEDGYQECQDIYYRNNIDYERPGSGTVIDNTGYNHVYENLKGHSMHIRTGNVGCVVRNIDDMEGTEIRWTTGNIRSTKFCRNYNNKTHINDVRNWPSEIQLSEHKVKNCVIGTSSDARSINSIVYEDCTFEVLWGSNIICKNCKINTTGYMADKVYFYDCIFGQEDSEEENPIRINHVNGERIFENCTFKGKSVVTANNSGNFKNCIFEDVRLVADLYPEEQTAGVLYENCTMSSSAENFIHIGGNAYSRNYLNIVFNNCNITHTGERFMYLYGKPTGNSKLEFHNCNIKKDTGVLLGGWVTISACPETSLQILFDNTTFSKELDASYAEDQSKVKILYKNNKN